VDRDLCKKWKRSRDVVFPWGEGWNDTDWPMEKFSGVEEIILAISVEDRVSPWGREKENT